MNEVVLISQSDLSRLIENAIEKKFREIVSPEIKKAQTPDWIPGEKVQKMFSISNTSLWRERKNPKTPLKFKLTNGKVYYNYQSVLNYIEQKKGNPALS